MKRIVIKSSIIKGSLIILGSLIFSLFSLCLYINPDIFISTLFKSPLLIKIIGAAGFILFFLGFIFLTIKFLKGSINFIIDEYGIIDNSNLINLGLIEWRDITEIRVTNVMSTKFILIIVSNPEKYIKKSKNKFILKLIRANMKMYHTPITISSNLLNSSFNELEKLIRNEFLEYKNQKL